MRFPRPAVLAALGFGIFILVWILPSHSGKEQELHLAAGLFALALAVTGTVMLILGRR